MLWLALFAWPFLTASLTCDRRLNLYALAGLIVLVATAVLPYALARERSTAWRAGMALAFAVVTVVVWVAGGTAGEVRIMCRLF